MSTNPERSEVREQLIALSEYLTSACLISAHDVGRGLLPRPEELPARPQLVILDSGGYELAAHPDPGDPSWSPPSGSQWEEQELAELLDSWPSDLPSCFVSYDNPRVRRSFRQQLQAARSLFKGRAQLSTLLLKPETRDQQTSASIVNDACAHADELVGFDVVGLTDSELGGDILTRMQAIAKLRRSLDEASVSAPIHVFGSLDPISTPLYFLAGAEIFDGLTWLRYGYWNDSCLYYQNADFFRFGVSGKRSLEKVRMAVQNIYYLEALHHRLRDFHFTQDFRKLPHSKYIRSAAESFLGRLKKGRS